MRIFTKNKRAGILSENGCLLFSLLCSIGGSIFSKKTESRLFLRKQCGKEQGWKCSRKLKFQISVDAIGPFLLCCHYTSRWMTGKALDDGERRKTRSFAKWKKGAIDLEKIEVTSLNTLVYQSLKQQIMENRLQPSERLEIGALAQALGVSKTPVLNALKALEKDGYVEIRQRSGTFVRSYTDEEVEAIFRFRLALEKEAAALTIEALAEADIASIETGLLAQRAMFLQEKEEGDIEDFFCLEERLHRLWVGQCPAIVRGELENLVDLTKRLRRLQLSDCLEQKGKKAFLDQEMDVHLAMLAAVRRKDLAGLQAALEQDMSTTCRQILAGRREERTDGSSITQ